MAGRRATGRAARVRAVRTRRDPDFIIFAAVVALLGLGVVMVFSASAVRSLVDYGDRYYFVKRQLVWAVLGLGALLFFMNFDYRQLEPLALPGMVITGFLLVLVLVPGVGIVAHGARRWLGLGPLAFQPSELVKLAMVLFLAASLSHRGEKLRRFLSGLVPYLVLTGGVFLLILQQPDLGTALAVAGTVGLMLFIAGAHLGQLAALGLGALPVLAWAIFGEEYRRRRFMAFLDPWADPGDSGYHIIQALYALGSGRLVGLGLGYGRQKYLYLPEPHTDFIFAIIGEELGFLGCVTVISLFCIVAWRGYRVAVTAQDRFGCLLAAGITTMITLQALMNLGVVTASIPITGIPLPFLSSGGSSLVFTLGGVGMLLNVSRYRNE